MLLPWSALPLVAVLLAPAAPASPVRPALDVLHAWDTARSAAYVAGDADRLRALYVPGSPAGAADVGLLRSYTRHGWRVTVMATQVRSVRVLARAVDGRSRWRLRIVDRVEGIADTPQRCRPLPASRYATHDLELMRVDGVWVVSRVRPGRSPAPR